MGKRGGAAPKPRRDIHVRPSRRYPAAVPRAVLFVVLAIALVGCGKDASLPRDAGVDPRVVIAVDRRVELMSIVARLAGFPEYSKPALTPYARAADAHFAAWRDHPAVVAAQALRREHGIGYNAPIGLAVYLDDDLAPRRALTLPLPDLDARWNQADAAGFVVLLQDFARASDFESFFRDQAPFRAAVEERVRVALDGYRIVDWFDLVFGPRPTSTFRVIPGLLTGNMAYAAQATDDDGSQEVVQVLSLPPPGDDGLPTPTPDTVYTLVHEFAHSYVNPVLDARADTVLAAAEPIYQRFAAAMAKQHYPGAAIMTNESVVRALVVLYARERGPAADAVARLTYERSRSFWWTGELADAVASLKRPLDPDALAATTRDVLAAWPAAHPP